jgi:hypothetical protein
VPETFEPYEPPLFSRQYDPQPVRPDPTDDPRQGLPLRSEGGPLAGWGPWIVAVVIGPVYVCHTYTTWDPHDTAAFVVQKDGSYIACNPATEYHR